MQKYIELKVAEKILIRLFFGAALLEYPEAKCVTRSNWLQCLQILGPWALDCNLALREAKIFLMDEGNHIYKLNPSFEYPGKRSRTALQPSLAPKSASSRLREFKALHKSIKGQNCIFLLREINSMRRLCRTFTSEVVDKHMNAFLRSTSDSSSVEDYSSYLYRLNSQGKLK